MFIEPKKSLFFPLLAVLLFGCGTSNKKDFEEWYGETAGLRSSSTSHELRKDTFLSSPLLIDTIYRSMQGPYEQKKVLVGEPEADLLWLKGYGSTIIENGTGKELSDGFMCHNNLNLPERSSVPWKVRTMGTSTRLFTLTEGQVKVRLPEGFGVPLPGGTELELVSQVLNHRYPDIQKKIRQEVTVSYYRDEDLEGSPTPLYQQPIFVTKQLAGPKGSYGDPVKSNSKPNRTSKEDTSHPGCAISVDPGEYNPYKDQYGRKFTGHWSLPTDRQELHTEVTPMMGLEFDTRIHYIGVHVHPFARSLAFRDITEDTTLFKSDIELYDDRIGIKSIEHYSSEKGIPVYKDHRYELVSVYECTDTTAKHSAMATMFLYLADK